MRIKNSIKNIYTGIILQIVMILLGMLSRKIFLNTLGVEFLGINGVLSNVISMLGLAELGIGIAISYSLYKPLAENNYIQVAGIMNLYSKLYRYIALIVATLGLILLPFIQKIVKSEVSNSYVILIYLIFLIDAIISYFLSYRRNILSANQKNYILNKITTRYSIVLTVVQMIILILTKNYILFLLVKVFLGLYQNIIIYKTTDKEYPFLKDKINIELDNEIKEEIIKNVKALFLSNISVYCVFGTDNILLSVFAGISAVGVYSNYTLIINAVKGLISQVFLGVTSSYGNFLVTQNVQESYEIFNVLYFINFWICTFCATSLFVLINPFIKIWIGNNNMILPILLVSLIVFNFYSDTMRSSIELVKSSAGLYSPYTFFKYWIVIEAFVNLFISIILAGPLGLGMIGIFLGTAISTMIPKYVLPWNIHKYVFNISSKRYYLKHVLYTIFSFCIVIITYHISNSIYIENEYILFIFKIFICITTPNIIILALFHRTNEYIYIYKRFLKRN